MRALRDKGTPWATMAITLMPWASDLGPGETSPQREGHRDRLSIEREYGKTNPALQKESAQPKPTIEKQRGMLSPRLVALWRGAICVDVSTSCSLDSMVASTHDQRAANRGLFNVECVFFWL
jgi:hypothetical protein